MIAICPAAENQTSDRAPRTGSLRRIDAILAEVLAGYALGEPPAAEENARRAEAAPAEPLIADLIALPADTAAGCTAGAQ